MLNSLMAGTLVTGISIAAQGSAMLKVDYSPCLRALNERSVIYKDKIFSLDKNGRTFLLKNEDGSMSVIGEAGAYKLSARPVKCTTSSEVSSLEVLTGLFNKALMGEAKGSTENTKELLEKCGSITGPKSAPGLMMGGPSLNTGSVMGGSSQPGGTR